MDLTWSQNLKGVVHLLGSTDNKPSENDFVNSPVAIFLMHLWEELNTLGRLWSLIDGKSFSHTFCN